MNKKRNSKKQRNTVGNWDTSSRSYRWKGFNSCYPPYPTGTW